MSTKQPKETSLSEKAGPHPARLTDDVIGGDDLGLPTGIAPEEAGKADEIKPDPSQVKDKH